MNIKISRYLDKRYKSKDNTFPVTIRLYCNRKYDLVPTGIALTDQQFSSLQLSRCHSSLQSALGQICEVEAKVRQYLRHSPNYNLSDLKAFALNSPNRTSQLQPAIMSPIEVNVLSYFEKKIQLCKSGQQYGSAECYQSTLNVIKRLCNKQAFIPFSYFTVETLKTIEKHFVDNGGLSISTVGKHFRNLRAIFKMALNDQVIESKSYPFSRYGYIIPQVTKAKKAVSRQNLKLLFQYSPDGYYEKRALSFFMFSYFGNGMNLKDIALLKWKDFNDGVITFYRKKTLNTVRERKRISVIVSNEMQEVINEFGCPGSKDDYIFPIVSRADKQEQIENRIHTRNRSINETLKRISNKLNFDTHVTLGMSRHTFANALKQQGVDVSFIQEALGHGSPAVTEHYLNSFEKEICRKNMDKLNSYYNN